MPLIRRLPLVLLAALAAVAGLLVAAGPAATADPAAPRAGTYVPVTPYRLTDTRVQHDAPVGHGLLGVQVAGVDGIPATGVGAVVLTVTVPAPHSSGYLTVYAGDTTRPGTSNLNFVTGQTVASTVISQVGANGTVYVYNGAVGVTDVVVDVSGYYPSGASTDNATFVPLTPSRILDTRIKKGGTEPAGHGKVLLTVRGAGGVPADAGAVALTLTATSATAGGPVTVAPDDGAPTPTTSNLNLVAGQTLADLVVTAVPADGRIVLLNGSAKPVQLVADVVGWFRGGRAAVVGSLNATRPARLADTRTDAGIGYPAPAAHGVLALRPAGRGAVPPTGVAAVLLTVTVTAPQRDGYLTLYADGSPRPSTSNINFRAGQTVADFVVAPVGSDGKVDVYNGSPGRTQVVVDVSGYYSALPNPFTATIPALPAGQTSQQVTAVSCTGLTSCVAVGQWTRQSPFAVGPLIETLSGTTWTQQEQTPPAHTERRLAAVSCVSADSCVAVGSDQDDGSGTGSTVPVVDVLAGGTWTATRLAAPKDDPSDTARAELSGVSCTSATSCVAVGDYDGSVGAQMLVETYDGTGWTPTRPATATTQTSELAAVSCPASGTCVAVGDITPSTGDPVAAIETLADGQWTTDTTLASSVATKAQGWTGVACAAAGSCVAVGGGSVAATLAGGTWTGAAIPSGLVAVSCADGGLCTAAGAYDADPAGDQQPLLATLRDEVWVPFGLPRPAGSGQFLGVSCVAYSACVAGGNAVTYRAGQPPQVPALLESSLDD